MSIQSTRQENVSIFVWFFDSTESGFNVPDQAILKANIKVGLKGACNLLIVFELSLKQFGGKLARLEDSSHTQFFCSRNKIGPT